MLKSCPECESGQIEFGGAAGSRYRCRDCGEQFDTPGEREARRAAPDKPPRGLARKLWEIGEAEAD